MDLLVAAKFDFLGKRRYAFVISVILFIIGLIAVISIPLGKANLGIDFAGGVAVQLKFEKPFTMEKMRGLLGEGGFEEADLQEFSEGNKLFVRLKTTEGDLQAITEGIKSTFSEGMPENPFVIDSVSSVGPTIGKRLQRDALWAVIVSLLGILIYVAWRFEFRFGVAAVVATFHDVLAVLGIYYITNKEINLLIITALLTLAGYSLTDTVVVFDRIRENLRRRGKDGLEVVINRSINEVLRRTIVTSVTTLIVLVSLFTVGGEVIHDFSLALILGVLVGTYSSIFVASPLLLLQKGKRGKLIH
ncbi:MAG: protein translocase subunit SecF [Deltaproteobacteria bacterium]|nr:protein translocase subunit SecF [Deltaproteobacteria bacterium]